MLRSEIAKMLDKAKKLVDEASARIGNPTYVCGHCGTKRYRNFDHKNMIDMLTGASGRLERVAEQLRKMGGDADDANRQN
jgi:hypothetical protein